MRVKSHLAISTVANPQRIQSDGKQAGTSSVLRAHAQTRLVFSVLLPFYTPGFVSGMGRSGMFLNMMSPNPVWINMYFTARLWGETDEWKTKISWLAEELAVPNK